jgi:hypothetical protein
MKVYAKLLNMKELVLKLVVCIRLLVLDHKYTWTSPDSENPQTDWPYLVQRRRLDVRSFKAADFDTYNYLMVSKFRQRLAVNKTI